MRQMDRPLEMMSSEELWNLLRGSLARLELAWDRRILYETEWLERMRWTRQIARELHMRGEQLRLFH
jgi:hypothetical protein